MATIIQPGRRGLPARVQAGAARTGLALRGYWPASWKVAMVMIALLVIRMGEIYPPVARIRPTLLSSIIIGMLLMQRVGPAVWTRMLQEPIVRWTAVYMAAIVGTIPFAIWPGGAFKVVYTLPFEVLLVVTLMVCESTRENLDRIVRWTVLLGGIYALYINTAGNVVMEGGTLDRLGGAGMYDPNDLAALMVLLLMLAIGMTMRERPKWRLIGALCGAAVLMIALRTGSRGGTIALAVGTLTLLLGQKPGRFFALSAVIAAASPIAWLYGPESFRVRTMSLFSIENDYTFQTDAGRWVIWGRAIGYFIHRPIIGIGANNFGMREGQFFASELRGGAWLTAHNTWLQVLVENGLLGGIPLFVMVWIALRGTAPLWRRPPASAPGRLYRPELLAALTAFLAAATFLSHGYNPLLFFMLTLGAFAGRVALVERAGPTEPARPATRWGGRFGPRAVMLGARLPRGPVRGGVPRHPAARQSGARQGAPKAGVRRTGIPHAVVVGRGVVPRGGTLRA